MRVQILTRSLRRNLQCALNRLGLEFHRPGGPRVPYRLRRVRLPGPYAELPARTLRQAFDVDIRDVTTFVGFSCAPDGWHPYVETLRQYQGNPRIRYEDTSLFELYERFRPANVQEAVLDVVEPPLPPVDGWPPVLVWNLWTLSAGDLPSALARYGAEVEGDFLYFGPVDHDKFGRKHFERLLHVYESIRTRGYQPHAFPDGQVEGYFLAHGDTYRFVVTEGHHRVAALQALDIGHVQARLWPGLATVWFEDLDRWTLKRGGVYPRPVAERLFNQLLKERGYQKAWRLGLIVEKGGLGQP